MRLYFGHNNACRLPTQVVLMLISMAISPIDLPAQGPAPKPPGEVLRAFRKLDSEGGRLTTNGWYRAARYFVKPVPPPRYRIVEVIKNETIEEHPRIIGNRTKVHTRFDSLGQIDSGGRFTSLVVPSLLDPSGQLTKKPWGPEIHGPAYFGAVYELVLTDTHWEFTPGRNDLREVRGAPEWRIEGAWRVPAVTVQAAILYLTRLHDESGSEVMKRNATKSIADLQRLASRKRDWQRP